VPAQWEPGIGDGDCGGAAALCVFPWALLVFTLARSSPARAVPYSPGARAAVQRSTSPVTKLTPRKDNSFRGSSKRSRMQWRDLLRNERGQIAPHAPPSSRESNLGYGFNPEEYPALANAADAWADACNSRLKRWRWRLRLRSKK
jgi:hypothetical protein